jgi:hypothetical protein
MKIRYRVWLWIGQKLGILKEHNLNITSNILKCRQLLEDAMTPQLREMLNEEIKDDE